MRGTISTMINFSLLSILQRLHKLSIKEDLQSQSETEQHKINFPRLEIHHKKVGHGKQEAQFFNQLTEKAIYAVLERAENQAKEAITILSMADEMKKQYVGDSTNM